MAIGLRRRDHERGSVPTAWRSTGDTRRRLLRSRAAHAVVHAIQATGSAGDGSTSEIWRVGRDGGDDMTAHPHHLSLARPSAKALPLHTPPSQRIQRRQDQDSAIGPARTGAALIKDKAPCRKPTRAASSGRRSFASPDADSASVGAARPRRGNSSKKNQGTLWRLFSSAARGVAPFQHISDFRNPGFLVSGGARAFGV